VRSRWGAAVGAVVLALALAVGLTTAPPGSTASAYGPGLFAYTATTDRGFSYHVYVTDTAGTGRRLLTTRRAVGRPAFSPDGRQVAFAGPITDDSDGRYGIYVVNVDGSELRLLTAPRFADLDPAWSPDGRVIAYTHNSYGNMRLSCCSIGLMYADGSSQHLVPGTTYGLHPTWSADSRRLAYAAYDGLHAVNTDGSANAVLVRGTVGWPAWSPDGSRIAYVRGISSGYSQVQVVGAGGGAPVAVESLAAQAESPAWGLDGRTLYYVLFHGYGDEGRTDSSVWRSTAPGASAGRLFSYGTGLPANVYGLAFFGGPPQLPAKPSAVSWGTGRLDVFVRGTNSALYHKAYDGAAFGGWEGLGGLILGNPGAVSWGNRRLDVFVRGTNSLLYHKSYNGSAWSSWHNLGVSIAGDPAAVSWAPGRLDVFYRDVYGFLGHTAYDGSWKSERFRAQPAGDPTAVSFAQGRLDVFYRGTNAALGQVTYAGSWSAAVLGGVLTADPAAASRGRDRLDVAVRGPGGYLYTNSYNGAWSGFQLLGGPVAGEPDAAFRGGGAVDLVASGSPPALSLVHAVGDAGGWHRPEQQAGPLGGMPESVSWGPGRLDVFYRGTSGTLRHRSYDGTTWSVVHDLGGALAPS